LLLFDNGTEVGEVGEVGVEDGVEDGATDVDSAAARVKAILSNLKIKIKK